MALRLGCTRTAIRPYPSCHYCLTAVRLGSNGKGNALFEKDEKGVFVIKLLIISELVNLLIIRVFAGAAS